MGLFYGFQGSMRGSMAASVTSCTIARRIAAASPAPPAFHRPCPGDRPACTVVLAGQSLAHHRRGNHTYVVGQFRYPVKPYQACISPGQLPLMHGSAAAPPRSVNWRSTLQVHVHSDQCSLGASFSIGQESGTGPCWQPISAQKPSEVTAVST